MGIEPRLGIVRVTWDVVSREFGFQRIADFHFSSVCFSQFSGTYCLTNNRGTSETPAIEGVWRVWKNFADCACKYRILRLQRRFFNTMPPTVDDSE